MDEGQILLIEKPQVFVYEIPERNIQNIASEGHINRASDWNIYNPVWNGKLLIYKAGHFCCRLELRDKNGNLYGRSVLKEYPGPSFEPVMDSSRYFTLNISNIYGILQRIGVGFTYRIDSLDLHNVTSKFFSTPFCSNNEITGEVNVKREINQDEEEVRPAKRIKKETDLNVVEVEPLSVNELEVNPNTEGQILIKTEATTEESLAANNGTEFSGEAFVKVEPISENELDRSSNTESQKLIKTEATTEVCSTASKGKVCLQETLNVIQSSERESEMEDLTEIHDNLLAIIESQKQPPWPQPKTHRKKSSKWNLANFYTIFKCSVCSQNFYSQDDLIQHFRETHNLSKNIKSVSRDVECNPEATPSDILSRTNDRCYHYITSGLFKCDKCTETFSSSLEIIQHWRTAHSAKCACHCQCGLPFQFRKEREHHRRKFHAILCPVCNKTFFNLPDVDEHLLLDHLCDPSGSSIHRAHIREFSCPICPGWFDFRKHCWIHVAVTHANFKYAKEKRKPVFPCPECNMPPLAPLFLIRHLGRAHKYDRFTASLIVRCLQGSDDCISKSAVVASKDVQTLEISNSESASDKDPVQQTNCSQMTSRKKVKKRSKKRDRSQTFPECERKEDSEDKETVGAKTSAEHKFTCTQCSTSFKLEEQLKQHSEALHNLTLPFKCCVCGKRFKRAIDMGNHKKALGHYEDNDFYENIDSSENDEVYDASARTKDMQRKWLLFLTAEEPNLPNV